MTVAIENRGRLRRVASRLGLTEGQIYTLAIGLTVAAVTLGIGVPAAIRQGPAAPPRLVALPPGTQPIVVPPAPPAAPAPAIPLVPYVPPVLPAFAAEPAGPAAPTPAASDLLIRAAGWADADAGTPLAGLTVPDGGLPVASRLGQDQRRSFIRLDGDKTILHLALVGDPGANILADSAVVRACPITSETWIPRNAEAFGESPAFDCTHGVVATRPGDGSFAFDLSVFPDRAGTRGFALVPGPGAPPSFQVVFSRQSLPSP